MERKKLGSALQISSVHWLFGAALAVVIFIIDTATTLDIAIAVLYVVVVLLAANLLSRRGVLVVASACLGLTILSYVLSHGLETGTALIRCLMSVAAIVITTLLALKHQSAASALRSQAELLDLTHDAIFVRDMSDEIIYWNRGAENLYDRLKESAVGASAHQILRTIFPSPLPLINEELLRTGRWEGELIHCKQDGTRLTVDSRWALQRDARGHPQAVLEINTDITERKRAEKKIQEQERSLQLAIDTIPTLVWRARADGDAEFFNHRWLEYTGIEIERAQGWGWCAAIHPDDVAHLEAEWRKFLGSGQRGEVEARLRRVDGEYRWFLFRAEPLRDEYGKVVSWYGTNTDIEDRRRAEDALRRSEAYSVEAQRLSLTGSFGWRLASGEIFWSEQTYRIFGYDREVTPSLDLILRRVHPDDVEPYQKAIDQALRGTPDIEASHRIQLPDGTIKHLRFLAHATADREGQLEYVGAVMDVSAVKRSEEALQEAYAQLAHVTRMATLGELTASIAHEVNQPLAGIVTNGEACLRWLARGEPQLDEARNAVERMISDGRRAGEVVRRLRALARRGSVQRLPVNLNDIIDEAIPLVSRELSNHRVSLKMDLAPELPPVIGDRIQLQQVIINLMVNGIQAMPADLNGRRELAIRSEHVAEGVLVAIRDSGVGFDADSADQLFNAFFSTKPDGMGMGLSICRSIIESHGGRVWASRNEGSGATFQFVLPINVSEG